MTAHLFITDKLDCRVISHYWLKQTCCIINNNKTIHVMLLKVGLSYCHHEHGWNRKTNAVFHLPQSNTAACDLCVCGFCDLGRGMSLSLSFLFIWIPEWLAGRKRGIKVTTLGENSGGRDPITFVKQLGRSDAATRIWTQGKASKSKASFVWHAEHFSQLTKLYHALCHYSFLKLNCITSFA